MDENKSCKFVRPARRPAGTRRKFVKQTGAAALGISVTHRDMARMCAQHLAGVGVFAYRGSVLATRLKVTGIDVFSAGDFAGGTGSEDIVYVDAPAHVYKKLVLHEGCLTGAVMVGDAQDAAWYQELIETRQNIAPLRERLVFGRAIATAC